MSTPNRVVKTHVPIRVIVSSVLIGLLVVGFIFYAVWQSGRGLHEARMSGKIVSKVFQPYSQPERQITLNRGGAVSTRTSEGEFVITVEVPQSDGTSKTFTVWLNDKQRYDAVKVGDSFDVGPYVVREK
jgi:uncharacterized protein YggT (Ycf19 family)